MSHFHGQAHFKGGFDIDEETIHPDASYWSNGAQRVLHKLERLLGEAEAQERLAPYWSEDFTWRDICLASEKILDEINKELIK